MKVRGKVRLMCEFCKKVIVRLNRDQHYVYVHCSKNARHKQRTKYLTMTTQAESHYSSEHSVASDDGAVTGVPCLPEPTFAAMQQHMLSRPSRTLLANRHTSVLGELYWRAAVSGQ